MKVIFKPDVGPGLGLGHLMRCLSLAAILQKNAECTFLVEDPAAAALIIERGFKQAYEKADWLIIDSYIVSKKDLEYSANKILYLDDNFNDQLINYSDLIIGNGAHSYEQYAQLSPSHPVFTGPAFIPLREEFQQLQKPIYKSSLESILITMGGEDPHNLTHTVLHYLTEVSDVQIEILLGPSYKHPLEQLKSERVTIHQNLKHTSQLYQKVDLAITAAGTSVWELAAAGIPMIAIAAAENQIPIAQFLEERQLAYNLGWHQTLTEEAILEALKFLASCKTRQDYGQNGQQLIDGKGSERIAALLLHEADQILFTPAASKDSKQLWEWRNDPITRQMSQNTHFITWEEHQHWFSSLNDTNKMYMIQKEKQNLGTMRFDLNQKEAEISINLAPEYRGRGLGKVALMAACSFGFLNLHLNKITAKIKPQNSPSIKAFLDAGFIENHKTDTFNYYMIR